MQIKHWNMNKTGIGKSKRRTSANRIPCGSRWMAIPWRWLSRKSSRRRNLIAAICLQSRQYIAISNSLDCRQRKVCYYNVMFIQSLFSCPVYIQIKFSGILVKIIITILTEFINLRVIVRNWVLSSLFYTNTALHDWLTLSSSILILLSQHCWLWDFQLVWATCRLSSFTTAITSPKTSHIYNKYY